ncbi:MAG: endonuclease III [Zetaproteobacteria bacterium]|nr:endonuclease III [Zetaproteobacteria bacterium]
MPHPNLELALETLRARWPEAKCELFYTTPYQLLVSVVLSAQATDKSVNKAMRPLYEKGLDIDTVLSWGQETFLSKIRSIGLAPTKSKNVIALSRLLRERHQDQIPSSRDELEALPGVGPKTASVILGECFGQPTLAVDTHVYRVTQRLGLHNESSPLKAEKVLTGMIPGSWLPQAHHLFIFHGRYICAARKPLCADCPMATICPSQQTKTLS